MNYEKRDMLKVGDVIIATTEDCEMEGYLGIVTNIVDDGEDALIHYISPNGLVDYSSISDIVPLGYEFPELRELIEKMDKEIDEWLIEKFALKSLKG